MGAGKQPEMRYRVLHSCFKNRQHKYWTAEELLEHLRNNDFDIELRQLKHDIYTMRYDEQLKYHAPIEYCKRNKGYHYTDPDFDLDTVPLNAEEVRSLAIVANLLKQFKGAQFVRLFEGAIDKVVRVVEHLRKQAWSDHSYIHFEQAPYYKGIEHVDTLHQAMVDQKPQRIAYKKFASEKTDAHVFHPYFLREYKSRWYVLGYSARRHVTLTLGLDRMETITPEDVPFKPNTKLNLDEYYKHTLGITHSSGPVEDIRLWFTPQQGYYIKTKHIHETQEILEDTDQGLVISLRLIVNFELLQELLSYCPHVKVIQPTSLKEKLNELLRKGLEVNGE
jgi:predicted DNA-binding transcriptional regulator YafY